MIERGIAIEGGAQESRLAGGSQRLSFGLAHELGERVVLDEPALAIDQRDATRVTVDTPADWCSR